MIPAWNSHPWLSLVNNRVILNDDTNLRVGLLPNPCNSVEWNQTMTHSSSSMIADWVWLLEALTFSVHTLCGCGTSYGRGPPQLACLLFVYVQHAQALNRRDAFTHVHTHFQHKENLKPHSNSTKISSRATFAPTATLTFFTTAAWVALNTFLIFIASTVSSSSPTITCQCIVKHKHVLSILSKHWRVQYENAQGLIDYTQKHRCGTYLVSRLHRNINYWSWHGSS